MVCLYKLINGDCKLWEGMCDYTYQKSEKKCRENSRGKMEWAILEASSNIKLS